MLGSVGKASVIICAYTESRWQALVAAVESVKSQSAPPHEIIVVVDYNPALLARVRAELPGVVALANSNARGLAGARNAGIAAASGEVLVFLDDDAVATPHWLAQLLARYADESVLGVGGAIRPLWEEGEPAWFPEEFNWVVGCTYKGLPETSAPVRNLIGANMSFRRAVFGRVGGFNPEMGRIGTLPLGCEETEFCIRLRQHSPSGVLLYEPAALVHHRAPAARGRWRYFFARCYAEGLSKASVARLVGATDGLASERAYTLRTLPLGVWRGLRAAVVGREPWGLGRAFAIVAGLAVTAAGYLRGSLFGAKASLARTRPEGRLARHVQE
ncbi:MAG: glycosyltransferase family 2 protein [Chloroflexota bacterium]